MKTRDAIIISTALGASALIFANGVSETPVPTTIVIETTIPETTTIPYVAPKKKTPKTTTTSSSTLPSSTTTQSTTTTTQVTLIPVLPIVSVTAGPTTTIRPRITTTTERDDD